MLFLLDSVIKKAKLIPFLPREYLQ